MKPILLIIRQINFYPGLHKIILYKKASWVLQCKPSAKNAEKIGYNR